ncbi:MFS transporter [Microbulbifer sp. OS29]|uniref:MFS transporter n=1 Tax=Microbulbifer okhotskensis TaxID=2926617 RepID=A0A9X2EMG2_9GAMM|nr:MFS transporter [Microbulbifer okhotskensis]MCO1334406.1 MFS transporter [Microbulbifer okhotskensis]
MKRNIYWFGLFSCYGALFLLGFIEVYKAPIYPRILDFFAVSPSKGSTFFFLSTLSALIMTLSGPLWVKRIKVISGLGLFVTFMGVGSILSGTSGYLHSFALLMLGSFLFGVGTGGSMVLINVAIPLFVPQDLTRQGYCGLHSTYGVASILSPLFPGLMYKFHFGWEGGFYFFGGLAVAIVLFILGGLFKKRGTKRVDGREINPGAYHEASKHEKEPKEWWIAIGGGLIVSAYNGAEHILASRFVLFLEARGGPWAVDADILLSIFFAFLCVGRIVFTFVLLRGSTFFWLIVSFATTTIVFLLGYWINPLWLPVCGLTLSYLFPYAMEWLTDCSKNPPFTVSFSLGMGGVFLILAHALVGWLDENYGIQTAIYVVPVFLICGIVFCLLIAFVEKQRQAS